MIDTEGEPRQIEEAETPQAVEDKSVGVFEQITKVRDALLAIFSGAYLFGYAVWCYWAYRENLGLLPALDLQYVAAGLVPWLAVLAAAGAIVAVELLARDGQRAARIYVGLVLVGAGLAAGLIALGALTTPLGFAATAAVIALPVVLVYASQAGTGWFGRMCFRLLFVGAALWVAVQSALNVYPGVPQSLGGFLPRSACLEVKAEGLTYETARRLCNPKLSQAALDKLRESKGVLRTLEVSVYFLASDRIIFKLKGDQKTFELARSSVVGILYDSTQPVREKLSSTKVAN